jgi:hypothetical protein
MKTRDFYISDDDFNQLCDSSKYPTLHLWDGERDGRYPNKIVISDDSNKVKALNKLIFIMGYLGVNIVSELEYEFNVVREYIEGEGI